MNYMFFLCKKLYECYVKKKKKNQMFSFDLSTFLKKTLNLPTLTSLMKIHENHG